MSHPTWVRGLKLHIACEVGSTCRSHPTWVRGLKHNLHHVHKLFVRRTLRGCVD